MIVKVMKAAGVSFPGVKYNDKKVEKGNGELMLMKNFPPFITENSAKEEVKNYLSAVSKSDKVKKPQFHAVISTKFLEHTKEELTKVAEEFMSEMGYDKQPFLVVFHNDTENNHVHIVSTRVDKSTGKKIDDSYEKLKSQKALSKVIEKLYEKNSKEEINKLLNYKLSSTNQLGLLLQRSGYKLSPNKLDENLIDILKNGVCEKTLSKNQICLVNRKNDNRSKQLKAILIKYSKLYSNQVFKVEDCRKQESTLPNEKHDENWKPKIEFESELQKKLRDVFGIDIVFHHKDDKQPFGYTLIDHKTGAVYKGSEILKMNEIFEFTEQKVDKRLFESLKDYNILDEASKQILIKHLYQKNLEVKDFMLFSSKKRKDKDTYSSIRNEIKDYLKNQKNEHVKLLKSTSGEYYAIHDKYHFVGELRSLIGEREYEQFIQPSQSSEETQNKNLAKELNKSIDEMFFKLSQSSGGSGKDPMDEHKKRRKKTKR